MVHAKQDLWPPDIAVAPTRTPLTVLREQASLLGPRTSNLLEAEVQTKSLSGDTFDHYFVLVAPTLGNYRYCLFVATHGIDLYPVRLKFDGESRQAENEEGLVSALREIFAHSHTRKVIDALLSQSVS